MPRYAYDQVIKVEDTYYIIWCTDFYELRGIRRQLILSLLDWRILSFRLTVTVYCSPERLITILLFCQGLVTVGILPLEMSS